MHRGNDAAVLGRDVIDVVDGTLAAGAGHVLDDDAGLAGDMAVEMACQCPRRHIVAAARRCRHDQRQALALVKRRDILGHCRAGHRRRYNSDCQEFA